MSTTSPAMLIARSLRPHRWQIALLAVLVPGDVVLQLAAPQVLRRFIDGGLAGIGEVALQRTAAVYGAVALGSQALTVLTASVAARLAWRTTNRLRHDLLVNVFALDGGFFRRHPPGELLDRIDGDVTKLAGLLSGMLLEVGVQALLFVGVLGALFHLDVRFGLLFAPLALMALLVLARMAGRALPLAAAQRGVGADLLGFLEERVAGLEDIGANGAGPHVLRGLWERMAAQYAGARRVAEVYVWWPATAQAFSVLSFVLALALGAWLHVRGEASVGTVFAGLAYAMLLRGPLASVTTRFRDLQEAVVSLRRVGDLLDERSAVPDGTRDLGPGALGVALDSVRVAYDGGAPALADVSFRLDAGRRLGVVGRSGAGKTTMVRTLFRFLEHSGGVIRVGGEDLRTVRLASVRRRVALVTQEVEIFRATLRDNVTLFDPDVTDEQVRRALGEVGLAPWAASLPAGLDTVIGPDGAGMSAGQEQLLALARAFLDDPGLVLLDEPSSRVDPLTDRLLHEALERLLVGRTAVIVAHRLETLRGVDQVLVLEGGRVVEQGERTALLADPGSTFHRMVRSGQAPG